MLMYYRKIAVFQKSSYVYVNLIFFRKSKDSNFYFQANYNKSFI